MNDETITTSWLLRVSEVDFVCDECRQGFDHKGHCDICGRAILSNSRQHDAVFGHERETDEHDETSRI